MQFIKKIRPLNCELNEYLEYNLYPILESTLLAVLPHVASIFHGLDDIFCGINA
jgi:hypothetical protein